MHIQLSTMMPTLVKAVVRFGWTMSIVQAWSPASLSDPKTSWEITTVVTVKMLGLDARVRIERALQWLVLELKQISGSTGYLASFPGSPTCEQKFGERERAWDILSDEKHHS